jgi:hypothetical protein
MASLGVIILLTCHFKVQRPNLRTTTHLLCVVTDARQNYAMSHQSS